MTTARACDGCTFCCWAFGIDDVPLSGGFVHKPPLLSCHHACAGCGIHSDPSYPPQCRAFVCPYLSGDDIHRPDTFESLLHKLDGSAEGYIPAIPSSVPVNESGNLIINTRTILAAVVVDNHWQQRVIRLDTDNGRLREAGAEHVLEWVRLMYRYGVVHTMESHG